MNNRLPTYPAGTKVRLRWRTDTGVVLGPGVMPEDAKIKWDDETVTHININQLEKVG